MHGHRIVTRSNSKGAAIVNIEIGLEAWNTAVLIKFSPKEPIAYVLGRQTNHQKAGESGFWLLTFNPNECGERGDLMIKSPCKNCSKAYLPKDICSRDCKQLKLLQKFQLSRQEETYQAIDCTDGDRYGLCLPA